MRTPLVVMAALMIACGSKVDPPPASTATDSGTPADDTAVAPTDSATTEVASETGVMPTEARTCKRLQDAMCGTATEACCTKLSIPYAGGGCREAVLAYCTARIDAVSLGRATYDDSKLEDCAKAWTASITTCQSEFIPYLRGSLTCAQLFNGTKAPGSTCTSSIECNSPPGSVAYCDNAAKRCRASSISPEGGPCNFTGSTPRYCDEGLYCDVTGAMSVCKKALAPGAMCSETNYIACGYSHTCVSGTCGTGLAAGATCTEARECSSWNCNMGKCNDVLYPMVDKGLCNASTM
jgi:hypothetical protein